MIEELCCGPSSVHLLHQVDSELHDVCSSSSEQDKSDITNIISAQPQHHSLIRLESGRVIWWSDNGIKSNRLEVMLRRRMRYLQEEQQQQQQQQQQVIMREDMTEKEYNDNANTDCGKISAEKISNVDGNDAAALNEVSLESIDEQPTIPNQPLSHSNQELLRHCHENNIPVITVGCTAPPYQKKKKVWLDFGEEDVNQVGTTSTQQFLVHASTTFSTLDVLDTSLSTIPENDDPARKELPVNVTIERISSKQGFICMLHDDTTSPLHCEENYVDACLDPINLFMKDGDTQMIHVVWNPIHDGCVRENIELLVTIGHDQTMRHEICFVGSARGIETCAGDNTDSNKKEWNKCSDDCSEIDENASHFDLVIDGVGLIVTDESIECSSVLTNGGENDAIDSFEVNEIAQMMQSASISPKKASMAAQSLSLASENAELSAKKQLNPNGIMAAHQEIDSERMFAEESKILTETSQEFVNGLYMNDKVRSLLDDFDAESSTGDERSGRSTPTFGSLSSEEMKSTLSSVSQELLDRKHPEPQFETIEEEITMDINELDNSNELVSLNENEKGAKTLTRTVTSGHYDKVTAELNAMMDTSVDLQSSSQSDDFNSSSPEEEYNQLRDEKVDILSEGSRLEENQTGADDVRNTAKIVAADHYDNVTTELNLLLDTSEDLQSQSQSGDLDSSSPKKDYDRIQDEKFGIFALNESMSDDEDKDLKILAETSMDRSSEFDSNEIDTTIDSDRKRNQYGELSSDLDDLMLEFSELEQFTLMQREYLLSPTAHDFQTQLENINEQIDSNLTPSPGRGIKSKISTSNKAENTSPANAEDAKPANYTTTPKDSAQRCYFYRPPRTESNGPVVNYPPIPTQRINRIEEKRATYKSQFRTELEAETSFQTIDSLSEGLLSSHASIGSSASNNCDSADSSSGILMNSTSLDELSSGESEFDQSSAAVDDDTSTLLSPMSSEAPSLSPSPSNRLEQRKMKSEVVKDTRSDHITEMKSKLSSLKTSSSAQYEQASKSNSKLSLTQNHQLKTPSPIQRDVPSLAASVSTGGKMEKQDYLSPSYNSSTISSTAKLQLKTPSQKPLDVAALTRSTISAQKAARMSYGDFSKTPITENSPSDRDVTGMSRLQTKKSLITPQSKRTPTQLKTPSSISAYEKHIERIRRSRSVKEFS